MAGERGNEEAKKKKEWNDGDATLHSMPASRILPLVVRSLLRWISQSDNEVHSIFGNRERGKGLQQGWFDQSGH